LKYFVDFDFGDFTLETTFQQDKFNSKLFMLNKKFIDEFKTNKYDKFDLIPIKQLVTDINKR